MVGSVALCIGMAIVCTVVGFILYFLPAIIAFKRNHEYRNIILILDLLFGWTFLGWAACLIWAFIDTNGNTVNKAFRNVGGNKYEDLARLQKLKENGVITETEFEIEKEKLLK